MNPKYTGPLRTHPVTPELLRAVAPYMFQLPSPIAAITDALDNDTAPAAIRHATAVSIVMAIGKLEAALRSAPLSSPIAGRLGRSTQRR